MSRYRRKIPVGDDGRSDLYDIAEAYNVKSNPQFHAMKKTIMAGQRGDKGVIQDIDEAIQALQRWKEMEQGKMVAPKAGIGAAGSLLPAPEKVWHCCDCGSAIAGILCPNCHGAT